MWISQCLIKVNHSHPSERNWTCSLYPVMYFHKTCKYISALRAIPHHHMQLILASMLKSDGGADNHTQRKWDCRSLVMGSGRSCKAFALVTGNCSPSEGSRPSQLMGAGQILLFWKCQQTGDMGYNFPGGIENRLHRQPLNTLLSSSSL